jgi:hypothetical protein
MNGRTSESDITRETFKTSTMEALPRNIAATMKSIRFGDCPVICLCDNYSSDIENKIKEMTLYHKVKLVIFSLQTSNLFQLLDLLTFRVFDYSERKGHRAFGKSV